MALEGLKSVSTAGRRMAGAFRAAGSDHAVTRNWGPAMRSGHSALRLDRERLSARLHDLVRNDGWAAAGVSRFLDNIVGAGFRLSSKPDWKALGITREQAAEVADQIEAQWRLYTRDSGYWCDVERMSNLAGLDGLAVRHLFADGDVFGFVGWRESPSGYRTCLQVVDPVRISNPQGVMDTAFLRDGVELDAWGAPVAYHVRRAHPGDLFTPGMEPYVWDRIPRETPDGRPVMLRMGERQWAGMTRSSSDLAPVLVKLKQLTEYDDSELQAAILNAKLAAVVQTNLDPDTIADDGAMASYIGSEADYYKNQPLNLDGVSLAFLHPGSTLTTVKAEHPHSNFEAFERNVLRNIASAAGMSYESLTADFSQANYSSIRAALVEFRKSWARKSALVAAAWKDPFFAAWLEDAIDLGRVCLPAGAPSFEAMPQAWAAARWIGPGTGWVDPLKEVQAARERLDAGLSTLEDEIAAQGGDYQETLAQRARELAEMSALGLDVALTAPQAPLATGDPDAVDPETGSAPEQPAARRAPRASIVPKIRRKVGRPAA